MSLSRQELAFLFVACVLIPIASLIGASAAAAAIAEANTTIYLLSILKWAGLGGWALWLARQRHWSAEDLYLELRGSYLTRKPASSVAIALLFVVVTQFAVMPRFAAAYLALGLPAAPATYLNMPATIIGRILGVLCAFSAAAGSEIVYRGYLRVLAEHHFRTWWGAAIAVSCVFGWAHSFYGLYGTFYTALIGFAFALLARGTRSLPVVILAHMFFDLGAFVRH